MNLRDAAAAAKHAQYRPALRNLPAAKQFAALEEPADALVVATEWLQYQSPDIERLARSMKRRFVFDGRNVLSPTGFKQAGFRYRGMGRS